MKKGFTLIELLVVVTIVGILCAMVFPLLTGKASVKHRQDDIQIITIKEVPQPSER